MHEHEILILRNLDALRRQHPAEKSWPLERLSDSSSLPIDAVRKAVELLKGKGYVAVDERLAGHMTELSEEGSRFLQHGFPEERIVKKLKAKGPLSMSALEQDEKSIGIGWAKKQGAIIIDKAGNLAAGTSPLSKTEEQRKMLEWVKAHGGFISSVIHPAIKELVSRGLITELKPKKDHLVLLTSAGAGALSHGSEMKAAYNLTAPVARQYPAKLHPAQKQQDRIRRIFFELGFEEMEGPAVESAFWNFDALFQPQDHPARDMADTFYVKGAADKKELPEAEIVDKVAKAHQAGWKYKWSPEESLRRVLRTHTTAASARYLVKSRAREAAKYFCIGRVYRNEAVDFKHLAEFYQVEGIVLWEKATFGNLLGLLREFYRKLGFEKIRFRPSYFPYTEPSVEVEVYFEKKKAWLELGGAGVFRPEVCMPLWGKYPVLAFGLSLERPLMLANDIEDIRKFYTNDLQWLREFKAGD
ncbi:MAG: phenylalanine--tRNA ligase subunit alpha [Candidatus Micrarchaeia archaeon]|jgi:phenylalanyl-tRNA synthetase alpha chain